MGDPDHPPTWFMSGRCCVLDPPDHYLLLHSHTHACARKRDFLAVSIMPSDSVSAPLFTASSL